MTASPAWTCRVADAFDRAAATYDGVARVQRILAGQLAQRIVRENLPRQPRVLEVGCGTGFLTRALVPRLNPATWLATDIAPAMVTACARSFAADPRVQARAMNAEAPDLDPSSIDLVCSSLAAQWFTDLPETLRRLYRLLAPGGVMVLSTLGPDTFREWREACAVEGLTAARPAYPSAAQARAMLGPDAWVAEEKKVVPQDSAQGFLRDIKAIGAQTPADGATPAPAGSLRRVLRRLDATGVTATYHVLTLRWRKEHTA